MNDRKNWKDTRIDYYVDVLRHDSRLRYLLLEAAIITKLVAADRLDQLFSRQRDQITAYLRFISMYVIRRELGLPLDMIGIMFGRDHATVINAIKTVEKFTHLHKSAITIQLIYHRSLNNA